MKTPQSKLLTKWATGISAFALLSAAAAGSTLLAFVPVQVDAQAAVVLPRGSNPQAATPAPLKTPPIQIAPAKKAPAATPAPVPKASNTPNPATKQSSKTQPVELQAVPADFTGRLQLEQLRETLADLTARYNANHPEILRIKAIIAEKERELAVETRQQQEQGQKITGTILDPTGGVIPGATISILDGETRELLAVAHSGSDGSYEIAPPKPNYYIQFVLPGFQTQVFSSSQLGPDPLTIEMELGQVREVVTVTTEAPPATENRGLKREPIRVGGNVVPPKLVQRADPVYPAEARSANVEGGVVVSALIDQEGNVKEAVVLSGHRLLRDAALDCVNQWRYQPALMNGMPWPIRLSITVIFKLQRIE